MNCLIVHASVSKISQEPVILNEPSGNNQQFYTHNYCINMYLYVFFYHKAKSSKVDRK